MKQHVMALAYPPKTQAVLNGECTQTIRKGRRIAEGDGILFHTWIGTPYRSLWGKRLRVVVREVIDIVVDYFQGIYHVATDQYDYWDTHYCSWLAAQDYIIPPTGIGLRDVLFGLNPGENSFEAQIIRWMDP